MTKLILLALAGSCGTLARYWLSGLVYNTLGRAFPWGTAAVNLAGCMLFGLLWVMADERGLIRPEARLIILVGFMGAFTTFSSLIFETAELARGSQWAFAALNIIGQNILGFVAFAIGAIIGRAI
ncbi:fluoride efflux transporter CrcB [Nitratidesulfovibrio liaohensis]|jgi:CrcB protein|uniref:Fluoride-specific ion channel FluC n=1 Tax=Nitratidesulfovibrio liaohensis TaxID=2604158 RepID=A0ABY9QYT0_9BACT|nr:fluoride efflux transporter CrcB [Nitratidesulfovibrio liaohensis]WMW64659.1 fluoride efflux transporter CrcB [Nitratidesulfovibrio liaohensis]